MTLDVPAMYADHHVVEVRRLLFDVPGVADVYASSSFHVVEVDYDEASVDPERITACLSDAGYLGDLPVPVEIGATSAEDNGAKAFFRHTAAYIQTGKTVAFAQNMPFSGRPLWPCPGMGPIESQKE